MVPVVTWFRNEHEHALHYFKYGLMQLAEKREIDFREIGNSEAGELLPVAVQKHKHSRTVAVRVVHGSESRLLILDGQDSIFQTSPLIKYCDVYYSCTYRKKFFDGSPFDLALPWQTECEVDFYRKRYTKLQTRFASELDKARPLMPIGPVMDVYEPRGFVVSKLGALRHRVSKRRAPWLDWKPQARRFHERWKRLMQLREFAPTRDVVLKDSLWGWPRHRVALHHTLAQFSSRFDIQAELHYRKPLKFECGTHSRPNPDNFPMIVGTPINNGYEEALAVSRVGVYATGFHYGCRQITTLAWLLGLRTLIDPLSFEFRYSLKGLGVTVNEEGDFSRLTRVLEEGREESWDEKRARQNLFDQIASPERAARILCFEKALPGSD